MTILDSIEQVRVLRLIILNTLSNQALIMDHESTTEIYSLLVDSSLASYRLTVVVGVVEVKQNNFVVLFSFLFLSCRRCLCCLADTLTPRSCHPKHR